MADVLQPNQRFANDYVIERPLAHGGMGDIYIAVNVPTRRRCALKVMRRDFLQDPVQRARFHQEAMVGSSIDSEHKVEVFAAGLDTETGMPWLAMELLEGETLTAYVQKRGSLPAPEVNALLEQLYHCLSAAHRVGIIHRDLKPDNVFVATAKRVGASRIVKVLDFGIAKLSASEMSSTTQAMGSPLWMAPEQSVRASKVTPATDVWAMALIAFWMLTGRVYWLCGNRSESNVIEFLQELHQGQMVPATVRALDLGHTEPLPPGFDIWFEHCTDRDPTKRIQDAPSAWTAWQQEVIAGRPSHEPSQPRPSRPADVGGAAVSTAAYLESQSQPRPSSPVDSAQPRISQPGDSGQPRISQPGDSGQPPAHQASAPTRGFPNTGPQVAATQPGSTTTGATSLGVVPPPSRPAPKTPMLLVALLGVLGLGAATVFGYFAFRRGGDSGQEPAGSEPGTSVVSQTQTDTPATGALTTAPGETTASEPAPQTTADDAGGGDGTPGSTSNKPVGVGTVPRQTPSVKLSGTTPASTGTTTSSTTTTTTTTTTATTRTPSVTTSSTTTTRQPPPPCPCSVKDTLCRMSHGCD